MVSYNALKVNTLLFVFCALFVLGTQTVNAGVDEWNIDFDDYSTAGLNGQNGWTSSGSGGCVDPDVGSMTGAVGKAVYCNNPANTGSVSKTFTQDLADYSSFFISGRFHVDDADGVDPQSAYIGLEDPTGAEDACRFGIRNGYLWVDGDGSISVEKVATSTWTWITMEVDVTNEQCRLFTSASTTGWVPFEDSAVSRTINTVNIVLFDATTGVDTGKAVDAFYVSGPATASGVSSSECSTCSRIINIDPGNSESTASSTDKLFTIDYYLNEDDDPLLGDIYIDVELTRGIDAQRENYLIDIPDTSYGEQQAFFNSTLVTEEGTYTVVYDMYIDRPFNLFNRSLDFGYTYFYVGTTTDFASTTYGGQFESDLGVIRTAYGSIDCTFDFPINSEDFDCLVQYIVATFVPPGEVLSGEAKNLLDTILLLPPWGYVTQLYLTLANPATSTIPTIGLVGQSDTPLAGLSLTLDTADGLSLLQSQLSASSTISGTERTYYGHFLFYWAWLWNIVFGLWLLNKLLGFNISIVREPNQLNDRTRFTNRGTIDMTKPKSGTIKVKKG